jgi:ORF6N domain-containing protein
MAKARVTDLARRLPAEIIQRRIYVIRTHKVMIDSDLAKLYEVATFNLNKAVKRNLSRFPEDFMFRLTADEAECLRFQNEYQRIAAAVGGDICRMRSRNTAS